jgi:hypothetical protein
MPATKGHLSGMQGVYLVAAELSARGFVVSPTLRNAAGADLLATDGHCKKAWSVQVKTNSGSANFWLLSKDAAEAKSDSHVYVFVNLKRETGKRPQFLVVRSEDVAKGMEISPRRTGSVWYSYSHSFPKDGSADSVGWEVFGLQPEQRNA